MAQIYVGTEATQIIPGAVASIKVQSSNAGLSTTGIVILVGEADAGPDFSLEKDLNEIALGPDQAGAMIAKYKGGPLVDAFKAAANPLNDPNIPGAPSRIIPVKTNPSTQATGALKKFDGSTYATLKDRSYGKDGNLISPLVEAAQSEVLPTTGSFTWIPPVGTVGYGIRVNGAAEVGGLLGANISPAAFVTAVDALAGVSATGGAVKPSIQASTSTLALAVVGGNVVTITYGGAFTNIPAVGDTVVIPTGSVIDGGAGDQNVGAYVVTAATSGVITATKLSDAGKAGAVAGTITAPIAVGAAAVSATPANDLIVYGSVTVTLEAGDPIAGIGKSLEIGELTTGTDLLSRCAYSLGVANVTWVSKAAGAKLLTSAAEYKAKLTVSRQKDNANEDFTVGGDVALKLGYKGTTATCMINDTVLTTVVTGGTGGNLNLSLKDFPTIADLVAYINAQTGYTAAVGSAVIGQLSSVALDDGTFGICSTQGSQTGRIKVDGYKFYTKITNEGLLVALDAQPGAGLPAPQAAFFLAGGARGGTTAAQFVAAIDACEKVRGNFIVPLFSRDATLDIADGKTDAASTYTIDAIHAYCRTHVLNMSKVKRRKNRQAFLSIQDSFAMDKEKAANVGSFRCSMTYLDQKVVASDGTVQQLPPYIDAAIAAGGQAAAFYKAIVRKFKNVSGSLQKAGDFNDQDDTQVEDALLAGLLPTRRHETGGYYFVSDQTTYSRDANFVFNSIQAVYVSDIIALTTAQRMEDAFAGQSQADVSAPVALAFLEAIFADFMRLKLIAPSDDAPLGFKNASVRINGPAMIVNAEVKVAGTIYFIPISFLVSQVQQSA